MLRLLKSTPKNSMIRKKSYKPVKVYPETKGNRNTNSISYNKKKTQINKNCIDILITLWFCGLKPHS